MEQSYKNHTRYVPLYHFVSAIILLLLTIAAFIDLFEKINDKANLNFSLFLVGVVIVLWLIWFYARAFALKAQDRIIMLEEKLRYHQLTGKQLHTSLRPSQIIALRFASDAEFPSLADKAASENLNAKAIKEHIKVWRPDMYRV